MQDIAHFVEEVAVQDQAIPPAVSLLTLPMAKLQIMLAGDIVQDSWPDRPMVEPVLAVNADGLWVLMLRRQGEHGKFDVPYIGTEILLADPEMGLIVALVGYHGTETWGRSRDKRVPKGQFYRFYRQEETGDWQRLNWQQMDDATRQLVLDLEKPEWARQPGKLSSQRKPPAPMVAMTSYKVVRMIDGRFYSIHSPEIEYVIGLRMKQAAKPGHASGWFSYPTTEKGIEYLESCVRSMPYHSEVETHALALMEVEIGGHTISYGHKLCSTYLCPVSVLEIRHLG